jgi:S1-C subfamily serine protease
LIKNNEDDISFIQTIHYPLDLSENFSIETIVYFRNGDNNSYGLIWGFKDEDNYCRFVINAAGFYQIGIQAQGIIYVNKWGQTDAIRKNNQQNKLKILRINDKMCYSINSQIVYVDDFYSFRGNNIGFVLDGKKELLFESLLIKQDIDNNYTNISNSDSEWKGNGTGFFVDYRGYIATNYHLIADATEIGIEFIRNGQKQDFRAKVILSDKQNDLAIIKIMDNTFKPFTILPYNFKIQLSDVGTNVFTLGYPIANVMGTEIKFTDGKISSKTGLQGDVRIYQISVPIQAGNSGGPLFDYDGNLVGITSSGLNREYFQSENVNYAIKSSYLKSLIDVLPVTIRLPNDKTIITKTLTEKIKILSDYIVLIKVK